MGGSPAPRDAQGRRAAGRYLDRLAERKARLRTLARATGWMFTTHHTDAAPAQRSCGCGRAGAARVSPLPREAVADVDPGPLGFTAPWLLVALVALPILWLILRAVPPAPIRRRFPGVALLLGSRTASSRRTARPGG
jgi:hypothetical protein